MNVTVLSLTGLARTKTRAQVSTLTQLGVDSGPLAGGLTQGRVLNLLLWPKVAKDVLCSCKGFMETNR